jgi:hypothetical protein
MFKETLLYFHDFKKTTGDLMSEELKTTFYTELSLLLKERIEAFHKSNYEFAEIHKFINMFLVQTVVEVENDELRWKQEIAADFAQRLNLRDIEIELDKINLNQRLEIVYYLAISFKKSGEVEGTIFMHFNPTNLEIVYCDESDFAFNSPDVEKYILSFNQQRKFGI